MQFVVQVRPYLHPHHEADVLIQVFNDDDVDRLVRWFDHNRLETIVHRLDDDDDVVDLAAADQLIMTLADLSVSGETVLRTAIQNGERMRRADRRAHANDLRRPPLSNTTNKLVQTHINIYQQTNKLWQFNQQHIFQTKQVVSRNTNIFQITIPYFI